MRRVGRLSCGESLSKHRLSISEFKIPTTEPQHRDTVDRYSCNASKYATTSFISENQATPRPVFVDMSIFQTASRPTASISLLQDAMASMTLHQSQRRYRSSRPDGEKRTTSTSRARRCQKSGDDEDDTCNSDPCKSLVLFLVEWDGFGGWTASVPESSSRVIEAPLEAEHPQR